MLRQIKKFIINKKWKYQHLPLHSNVPHASSSLINKMHTNNITSLTSTDTTLKDAWSTYLLPHSNNFQQRKHKLKINDKPPSNVVNAGKFLHYCRKTFATAQTLNQHAISKKHDIKKIQ